MDRPEPFWTVAGGAVPPAGVGAFELLLYGRARARREPALPATAGPGVYGASVLRGAQADGLAARPRLCGWPQAGAAFAAATGTDGGLSETALEYERLGAPAFSVSAARGGD